MQWRRLLLLMLCAMFAFGGTFTCKGENNSATFTSEKK